MLRVKVPYAPVFYVPLALLHASVALRLAGDAGGPDHADTITAQAADNEGNRDSAAAGAVVTFSDMLPSVSVAKTPSVGAVPEPGAMVTFAVEVHNTSVEPVTLEALDVVIHEPARRMVLRERAAALRAGLESQGWHIGTSRSQIVPVILGDPGRTMSLARALQDLGFLVPGIRPPAVPHGECLLRISLSCLHRDEDVRRLLDALAEAGAALGIRDARKP